MVSFMEVMTDNRACCASRKSKIIVIKYYHYYSANTRLNICSIGWFQKRLSLKLLGQLYMVFSISSNLFDKIVFIMATD